MKVYQTAAIVSGGASGLGLATAQMLAEEGARVAIFDVDGAAGAEAARTFGGLSYGIDVTDEASVVAALNSASGEQGPARILVNCAGVAPAMRMLREEGPHPIDAFRHTVDVNLTGSFIALSKFAAALAALEPIEGERGVIINTTSVAAFDGQIGHAAYAASKAGIAGMTLPLARDLASRFIRVMAIAPGIFDTRMLQDIPPEDRMGLCSQVPHPARLGRPEEFAQLVYSIIDNPMLNGEVIRLDGALRLAPY